MPNLNITYGQLERLKNLPHGTVVYACALTLGNNDTGSKVAYSLPVRGILSYTRDKRIHGKGDPDSSYDRYFVPFKKGSDTELAWSKCVNVESRLYVSLDYTECLQAFHDRVREQMRFYEACIRDLKQMEEDARNTRP